MKRTLLTLLALASVAFAQTKSVSPSGGGLNGTDNPAFRTALGGTTVGQSLFTLSNPGAITFPRFNADNTVSSLSASDFRTAIGGTTFGNSVLTNNASVALFDRFLKVSNGATTMSLVDASNVLTSMGATTAGTSFLTLTNPSAITFPRVNADNTVSALTASDFRTAIGAGTGGTTLTDSASLAATLSNETGTGLAVFGTSPTLTTPIINVTSDATGDVYYRSAGGLFTRLGIGTNGQVLSVSGGGLPSWSTVSIPTVEVTLAGAEVLTNKTLSTGTVFTSPPTMTIGSDATGDIYYRNAGGLLTRLPAGTDGHYLTLSSGIPAWAAAGGGLTNWTDGISIAAPNATVPAVSFTATNAATNVDAVFSPKGTGSIIADVPDNTAVGGNKRGSNAVDLQTNRSAATHVASGSNSPVIAGGSGNTASANLTVVVGGSSNIASAAWATIVGGSGNTASGTSTFVGGGTTNAIGGSNSGIVAGQDNTANGGHAFIGSGRFNEATQAYGVVSGGYICVASGAYAFIGSGQSNTAQGSHSTVAGGYQNWAQNQESFVGGGYANQAYGVKSAIVGGWNNDTNAQFAFVGAGTGNNASGENSAIAGGSYNVSSGEVSTASGSYSTTRTTYGAQARANGQVATVGDVQAVKYILRKVTTNDTITELTANAATLATTNIIALPNDSVYSFSGTVTARASASDDVSVWRVSGVIKRGANAASTAIVGSVTIGTPVQDAGASTWVLTIDADTTNGSLRFQGTGVAATNISWIANIETEQLVY